MTSWIKNYKEIQIDGRLRNNMSGNIIPTELLDFLERPGTSIRYISVDCDNIHNQDTLDLSDILEIFPRTDPLDTPEIPENLASVQLQGTTGTAESQGTPESQGTAGTSGTAEIQGTSDRPGTAPYNLTGGVQLIRFQRYRIRPSTR